MVKPLDREGRRKWYGYLIELNNEPEPISLVESQIRIYVKGWKGHLIDPEKKTLTPIIETVDDQSIGLKFQNGNYRACSYREIIDSEKVIRFWLAKGMAPESNDFRNSDPAILAEKISNTTYAPALAERIRKQLNIDHMIPPEVRILPMSLEGFKDEDFSVNGISDVQEKFILGELISRERNGSYWYRKGTLKTSEGAVVLFQFESHIIGSGVFLYRKTFKQPERGYNGEIVFDVKSLRTFEPMNQKKMKEFWPDFDRFSNAIRKLNPETYLNFIASLRDVKFGSKKERTNKALNLKNWRQGGKYYCLNATSHNKWVGFQESVIKKLKAQYGSNFFLVVWSDKNIENDFYCIPFNKVEFLFIEKYKTSGKYNHRWTGTIKNHQFMMRDNNRLAVDVSKYYGKLYAQDDIEKRIIEDLSAFKHEDEHFKEGEKKYRYTSFYERDPKLRAEAVRFHGKDGVRCKVCGFDFEAT